MKNKTWAVWITLIGGPLGLHRLYLKGRFDGLAAALLALSMAGLYGAYRMQTYGVDDTVSHVLLPLLGSTLSACALWALVYGLMDTARWNQHFNPDAPKEAAAGETTKSTVFGLVLALFLGATYLLTTLAFSVQHYFEATL